MPIYHGSLILIVIVALPMADGVQADKVVTLGREGRGFESYGPWSTFLLGIPENDIQ